MTKTPTAELNRVRTWAKEKIQGGSEPPWAWYQYMKLVETVDAILEGMDATTESSQQSVHNPEMRLRLVGSTYPQDSAPRRRGKWKIRMPM